jgi:hypothetical protein
LPCWLLCTFEDPHPSAREVEGPHAQSRSLSARKLFLSLS